ncbi:MAG: nucleotidyltransferase domain-containing protein [Bacteroidota bacterium]
MKITQLNIKDIGRVLRTLRRKNGLTQKALSEKVGLNRSSISRIENGHKQLTERELSTFLQKANYRQDQFISLIDAIKSIRSSQKMESQPNRVLSTPLDLSKDKIVSLLKNYFKGKPIKEVYLFGSTARDEHTPLSDLDLYLSFLDKHKVTLFDLGKMRMEINELTGKEVDLVLSGSEHDFVKASLHNEKVLIHG